MRSFKIWKQMNSICFSISNSNYVILAIGCNISEGFCAIIRFQGLVSRLLSRHSHVPATVQLIHDGKSKGAGIRHIQARTHTHVCQCAVSAYIAQVAIRPEVHPYLPEPSVTHIAGARPHRNRQRHGGRLQIRCCCVGKFHP